MIDWGSAPEYLTGLAIAGGALAFFLDRRKEVADRSRQAELENLQGAWDALIAIYEVPGALYNEDVKVAYVSAMRQLQLTGTHEMVEAIKVVGEGGAATEGTVRLLELIRQRYQQLTHVQPSASGFYAFTAQLPDQHPRVLGRAARYAKDGLIMQAEAAFVRATADDDLDSLQEFAKFLRRTGKLDQALAVNRRMIELPGWLEDDSIRAQVDRARVIANMGVIRRQQNMLPESESNLREAVSTVAQLHGESARYAEAYCRDNLALTLGRRDQLKDAMDEYEVALELRRTLDNQFEIARSLINVARAKGRLRDLDDAIDLANEAIAIVKDAPDEKLTLAHAYAALGDIQDLRGDIDKAMASAEAGLAINKELQSSVGEAVGFAQLSRLYLKDGRLDEAENAGNQSLAINRRSSNAAGVEVALQRLDDVLRARADAEGS